MAFDAMAYAMLATGLFALGGCSQTTVDRASINVEARTHTFDEGLTLRVEGGTVISTEPAAGDCPPKAVVRAQSFDLRVDVEDTRCGPQALHLTVTHLPRGIVTRTARPFLGAVEAKVGAAVGAVGGGFDLSSDLHDPSWTALGPEAPFPVRIDRLPANAGINVEWTICTDRNRQTWRALRGHRPIDACRAATIQAGETTFDAVPSGTCSPSRATPVLVDPLAGACTTFDAADGAAVPTAPLVVRHRMRLRLTAQDCIRFATWGNNALIESDGTDTAEANRRARIQSNIMAAVNEADPLFVIITGDMTSSGTSGELVQAQQALDGGLQVPWYATLGDREAGAPVSDGYHEIIGASTFAFDAGPTRIIVLDSGDKGLASSDRDRLSQWLTPDARLWWSAVPPPTRLVLTHVPPFDPAGDRGAAFRHRPEAAALVASLQRGIVPLLFSSQFSIYRWQAVADTDVVHSGGAGSPMETTDDDPHHWLLVTVRPGCENPPPCAAPELGCPCIRVDRVDVGQPLPELETCRPVSAPAIDGL